MTDNMEKEESASGTPTLFPSPTFQKEEDAIAVKNALANGSNATLIDIMTKRSLEQRLEIDFQFELLYTRSLIETFRRSLSGKFKKLMIALVTRPHELYAKELYDAMDGPGTDEDVLIEILCSLQNFDINLIKQAYRTKYRKQLSDDIKNDTSGYFRRLLLTLCGEEREEVAETDKEQAVAAAKSLYRAGEARRWGTDESTFNRIICTTNYDQLKLVFEEYENLTGHTISVAIEEEFSGDAKNGLLAIVRCAQNRAAFFAQEIHKAINSLRTDHRKLVRLVVSRAEIDLEDIKREYQAKYEQTLASSIKDVTSDGSYRDALLKLLGDD